MAERAATGRDQCQRCRVSSCRRFSLIFVPLFLDRSSACLNLAPLERRRGRYLVEITARKYRFGWTLAGPAPRLSLASRLGPEPARGQCSECQGLQRAFDLSSIRRRYVLEFQANR